MLGPLGRTRQCRRGKGKAGATLSGIVELEGLSLPYRALIRRHSVQGTVAPPLMGQRLPGPSLGIARLLVSRQVGI